MNNTETFQSDNEYYIAVLDSMECKTLPPFLKKVGIAFRFPDYYGNNVNAFWECIGDLSWLDAKNYSLVIKNSNFFLIEETEDTRKEIFDLLQKVKYDWANVPNFEGEEVYRQKADFNIEFR
jgi:RNAse (barnase) inhibitor barstar